MTPDKVITNLINLHADYIRLAHKCSYTIDQKYSETIAEAALALTPTKNTKLINDNILKDLKDLEQLYQAKRMTFQPGTALYQYWLGTTSKFRTGNTRFAVLKLFTGEVERNEQRRTIYGFSLCDFGCNGFVDAYNIS